MAEATTATSVYVKMSAVLLKGILFHEADIQKCIQHNNNRQHMLTSCDLHPLQKVRFGSEIFNKFQQQWVGIHKSGSSSC